MISPNPSHSVTKQDNRNLIIALVLTALVILGWKVFYENPMQAKHQAAKRAELLAHPKPDSVSQVPGSVDATTSGTTIPKTRNEAINASPRLPIRSDTLHGSINLKGARLDDLTLAEFRETLDKNSPEVVLLTPNAAEAGYFAEFGWAGNGVTLPDSNSLWQANSTALTVNAPVILSWTNPQGVRFEQEIALDDQYMFTVKTRVINASATPLTISPYSLINRTHNVDEKHYAILHEGLLGVSGEQLHEYGYEEVRKGKIVDEALPAWAGITDKYWLTTLIPDHASASTTKTTYQHYQSDKNLRYQVDLLSAPIQVAAGATAEHTTRFFAGAKLVHVLDGYATALNIPLFDRAVDFGALYFLTRPFFEALTFLHTHLGNLGLAIMALTICVKALLFPLANKSFSSMSQMKLLMPKMKEIRERYADDRVRMNQEIMGLYKEEGVNPAAGCLPLIIQMPVFFALYKVLFITIEMRHAPFYGWIQDLSAPDPTNIFTLFGLIPWDPPSLLHIGVLPIIMTITMILQQRLNPKPTDATQAQVMAAMPYMFLFLFASFPAGLVLYWAWNNFLSIMQQLMITKRYEKLYDKETGKRIKPPVKKQRT